MLASSPYLTYRSGFVGIHFGCYVGSAVGRVHIYAPQLPACLLREIHDFNAAKIKYEMRSDGLVGGGGGGCDTEDMTGSRVFLSSSSQDGPRVERVVS